MKGFAKITMMMAVVLLGVSCAAEENTTPNVYMTTDISAEGLVKVFEALGVDYDGR